MKPPGGLIAGRKKRRNMEKLKDLFSEIRNERTTILRFCNMRDRETMIDHRNGALRMIHEFEYDNEISESTKRFLILRICRAARETGLM